MELLSGTLKAPYVCQLLAVTANRPFSYWYQNRRLDVGGNG